MTAKASPWYSVRKDATAWTKAKSGKEKKSSFGWQILTLDMGFFGGMRYAAVPRTKPIARRK